jgi:diguanylate cyclase (GGDEF)-like protein/PAS domain S-box-containing protein
LTELDGEPATLATAMDVTEQRAAEEALSAEKEHAHATLASLGEGVIRTDREGRIEHMNPMAERLTGWPLAEARERPYGDVVRLADESSGKAVASPIDRCLETCRSVELPVQLVLVSRGGDEVAVRHSLAPVCSRQGEVRGAVAVFRDVSQLRELEREAFFLSRYDALTGLLNRRAFEILLEEVLEGTHGERFEALAYFDLDQFKVINDVCGHMAGDQLVQQVGHALVRSVRPVDVVARLGGDEFAALIAAGTFELAQTTAARMQERVSEIRFECQGKVFEPTVSAGLVPLDRVSSLVEALSAADAACYVAKEGGLNRVHVHQPNDVAILRRSGEMAWVSRLHRALQEDRFDLYGQWIEPLAPVDGETTAPRMIEIFLRMVDDDGTVLRPGPFVAAAERYRMVTAVDRWVVQRFLTLLATLVPDDDSAGPIFTVNLSGQSIGDPAFLDFLVEALEASRLPAHRLCFEITETAAVANLAGASRFVAVLRNLGYRFVLDDFGSGLSSFGYLKNLNVDFLKIDGEFVRDLARRPIQRAMVEAIHRVGRVMGIATIGEMVERGESAEVLVEIGVDYGQGYHFHRPQRLVDVLGSPASVSP